MNDDAICLLLLDTLFFASETAIFVLFTGKSMYRRPRSGSVTQFLRLFTLQLTHRIILNRIGLVSIIPTLAIDLIVTALTFTDRFRKKLFVLTLFYSFSIVLEIASELVVSTLCDVLGIELFTILGMPIPTMILSKILLFIAVIIIGDTLKSGNELKDWIKFIPLPAVILLMLVWRSPDELMEGNTSNLSFFIICVFGILLNIIMIVVFQRGNKKIQLEYRIQVLEDNRKLSKAHFMELREAYRKIERMAHDMKQHLNYLEAAPDIERVQSYIFKLKEKSFSHVLRFTGNFDIDVILNSKHHEAEKEKIILRVSETALPPVIDWLDPVDINIILGNALSNAIEACIIAEGNEINIALKYGDGWLKITITNPSVEPIGSKRNGAGLITTKAGGLHGLGMESMAAAAENYDGLMRYKYENGVFTMDILLQRR